MLRDEAKDRLIPESSIIIEYLDQHYPGATRFLPADAELARQTRFRDRFYDLHVHVPMQKIVTDRLRPAGKNDPHGVDEARKTLDTALGIVDRAMADNTWAMGDTFTLADCSAGPPLFYARHDRAARRHTPERRPLPQTADGTAVLRPYDRGGAALSPPVPESVTKRGIPPPSECRDCRRQPDKTQGE